MSADRVVDLDDWKASRMAARGTLRRACAELSLAGDRVVLTLPSGHVEVLRGVEAVVLAEQMSRLGEWAQDVESGEGQWP